MYVLQSWLYKLRGDVDSQLLHLSGAWRKKYFVLFREANVPVLYYYNKKPKLSLEEPRGKING
jgi:PH domain